MGAHLIGSRGQTPVAFLHRHGQSLVQGVGHLLYVKGMQRHRVLAELLVGAGVLRQRQHAAAAVDHGDFLGHEVHPVRDGVDHNHITDRVGGHREWEVLGHPQVDGLLPVFGVPGVDLGDNRADQCDVVGVLGHVRAARLEQREETDLSDQLRMLVEQRAEREEAAHDVLARIGAVHPQDELAVPVEEGVTQHGDMRGDLFGAQDRIERGRVHRDRVVPGPDRPIADCDQQIVEVDVQAEQFLRAQDEVTGVTPGVKADDVTAQQPAQQPLPDAGGQHAPLVRAWPRDVDEVGEHDVRAQFPDPFGNQVKMVILQQNEGLATAGADFVGDGVRVCPVDRGVAVLERVMLGLGDDGRECPTVQSVLDEPQDRVRPDTVEVGIGRGVGDDQVYPDGGTVGVSFDHMRRRRGLDDDRTAQRFVCDHGVLRGRRPADPDGVVEVLGEARQR